MTASRVALVKKVETELGPFDARHLEALLFVPRERFVRAVDVARANEDMPLPLDDAGLATISAPHAYLLSFRLLALAPGDALVELGSGSGYGAALAAHIVGAEGRVVTFEIDRTLAERAEELLAEHANVKVVPRDAMESAPAWGAARKVVCTFAVEALPERWLAALPEGGVLVAPVGPRETDQRLVRVARKRGELCATDHGAVRYVKNRSATT